MVATQEMPQRALFLGLGTSKPHGPLTYTHTQRRLLCTTPVLSIPIYQIKHHGILFRGDIDPSPKQDQHGVRDAAQGWVHKARASQSQGGLPGGDGKVFGINSFSAERFASDCLAPAGDSPMAL